MSGALRVLQIHPPVGHGVDVYRVDNLAEQIERAGGASEVLTLAELSDHGGPEDLVADRDVVILHRVAWDVRVEALVEAARARRVTTLFEADDLVFVPGADHWVDGVRRLPPGEVELYKEGLERYAATYRACDAFLASTPFLAGLRPFGPKRSAVVRNVLGRRQLDVARDICRARSPRGTGGDRDALWIGFGAGTATHDRDIEQVTPALRELLEKHDELRVEVVGPVDLGTAFAGFEGRVRRCDALPWEDWWERLAGYDIALAPLEPTNPYCRAKSALKFLEAAILDVPVVASRIDDYELEIDPGRTGFLARDSGEWFDAIDQLVGSEELRRQVASAARRHVEEHCTTEVRADESVARLRALREGREPEALPGTRLLDVDWLIPSPFPGSGGHANIFAAARSLERRGHRNTFHVDTSQLTEVDGEGIRAFVDRHFGDTPVRFEPGWDLVDARPDVAVATSWATAETVARAEVPARGYFVQDFENLFFPPGEDAVRAERTYHLGLSCVTLGGWLTHELRERYGADSTAFSFPVTVQDSFPVTVEDTPPETVEGASGEEDPRRLLFFAQPGKPRRGYRLGLEALERFHAACPDVKIAFFGSKDVVPGEVPVPFEDHGILSENQLADLYRGADAALVISMTNPTLVSPNMMRCGCVPVDLELPNNRFEYRHEEDSLLAEPTPDGIASALRRLFEDRALLEKLRTGGAATAEGRSLEATGDEIESAFVRRWLTGRSAERSRRLDAYQGDPGGWVSLADGPVRQEIDVRADGLARVALLLGTFDTLPGDLHVSVRDAGSGVVRAECVLPGDAIGNNEWNPVDFEPLEDSAGHALELVLRMRAADTPPVAVYWSAAGPLVDGCARTEDGEELPGPLCFQSWVHPAGAEPLPKPALVAPVSSLHDDPQPASDAAASGETAGGLSPEAQRVVELIRTRGAGERELRDRTEVLERASTASGASLDRIEGRLVRFPFGPLLRWFGLGPARETFLEPMRFVTAELRGALSVGQQFTAERAGLDRVLVRFATEGRRLFAPVQLRLRLDGPGGELIREVEIAPERIYDNQLAAAVFDPIPDSEGRRYCFEVSSPAAARGCGPRVWGHRTRGARGQRRFHWGRPASGRLDFLATYSRPENGPEPSTPSQPENGPEPSTPSRPENGPAASTPARSGNGSDGERT